MRRLSSIYALESISLAHISTFSSTCAQANHVTRLERHSLCACLTFSTGICAADPRSTAYIQYSLRMSRPFQRHVCRETSSCALRGILSAHVSAPQPTSAQAIINIRFLVVSPLRTSPWRDTEHEHVALISCWLTTRYKKPLFVVRILEWGLRTRSIYNTLIPSDIKKCRVRTP